MPITYNNLFEKFISWENLLKAIKNSTKRKKKTKEVKEFLSHLEDNIVQIRKDLINLNWKQNNYTKFERISGYKRRNIEAPSFKDRIIHHAIVQIIEPLFEKKFIYHSYSCRKNKGTHKSADILEKFIRIHKRNNKQTYILKADISKFFPSIDHKILWKILESNIKDKKLIKIIKLLTISPDNKTNKGIPIGALTSQLFANIYLNILDHYIKDILKIHFYCRYADDFIIIKNNKNILFYYLYIIKNFLYNKLKLYLNPKTNIFPLKQGIDFCGYRIWSTHRLYRKRIVKSFKKKLFKQLTIFINNYNKFNLIYFQGLISSYYGYSIKCCSYNTNLKILKECANYVN